MITVAPVTKTRPGCDAIWRDDTGNVLEGTLQDVFEHFSTLHPGVEIQVRLTPKTELLQ